MSDGNDDNWKMPEPVFRSSTGSLPKSFEETISQSFSPDSETVEIDEDDDILGVLDDLPPTEPANKEIVNSPEQTDLASQPAPENAVRAKAVSSPPKGSGMSMTVVFVLIALLAAVILAAYYFLNRAPSDSTFQ